MFLHLLLCYTLLITLINGDNTNTTVKDHETLNSTKNEVLEINNLSFPILTEGGPAVPSQTTSISELNPNRESAATSESIDLGIDKLIKETTSSRRDHRKGVVYHLEDEDNAKSMNDFNVSKVIGTNVKNQTLPSNKPTTKRPKKPLILSDEALNNANIGKNMSVTEINKPIRKIEPMSASRHPGMVMPIVITILVVPMFAVLGYMALRRGQEAWKNRHYKRMDFLLDGMYNE